MAKTTVKAYNPSTMGTTRQQANYFSKGFTIIELMVVLAVLGFLSAIAAPAITDLIRRSQITDVSQQLQTALMVARSESLKRGARVSVLPASDALVSGPSWLNGWQVFVDRNSDGNIQNNEPVLLSQSPWRQFTLGTDNAALPLFFDVMASAPVDPAGASYRVPSYVNGRPMSFQGVAQAMRLTVGLTEGGGGGGGTDPLALWAKHWRMTCVAPSGRNRTLKPGEQSGTLTSPTCPGGV